MSMASVSTGSVPGIAPAATHKRWLLLLWAATALIALLGLALTLSLWQRVGRMQEQLARQSADAIAQATQARTLAREASDAVRDTAARLALVETRVSEVTLQRAQLEDLMQSLSRTRDDNLVVDLESSLRLALQQAQATGNAEPLLTALRSAEQRVARAAQPRLAPLARAIAHDADRIRSSAAGNLSEALQKLDDLIRLIDDLPARNDVAQLRNSSAAAPIHEPPGSGAPWWRRLLWPMTQELRALVRVSRIDEPEAVLVSPQQVFYLHENLKLRLLHARLALLSRQAETARGELAAVTRAVNRYFDPAARRTQRAATLLQQLQAQLKDSEPPRIDDTLAALGTAAAGR